MTPNSSPTHSRLAICLALLADSLRNDVSRLLTRCWEAADRLGELGLPLDAAAGDCQYLRDGQQRTPLAGGPGAPGQSNLVEPKHHPIGDIAPGEIAYGSGFPPWVGHRPQGLSASLYSSTRRTKTRVHHIIATKPGSTQQEERRP